MEKISSDAQAFANVLAYVISDSPSKEKRISLMPLADVQIGASVVKSTRIVVGEKKFSGSLIFSKLDL